MIGRLTLLATVATVLVSGSGCEGHGKTSPVQVGIRGRVAGSVQVEGLSLSGVTVGLTGPLVQEEVTTSEAGIYSFTELSAGSYVVAISGYPTEVEFAETSRTAVLSQDHESVQVDFSGTWVPGIPNAPADLVALSSGPTSVTLSWIDASKRETGFEIHRRDGPGGEWVQGKFVGPNTTSYIDPDLPLAATYVYRVRACNALGCSDFSNESMASTPDPDGINLTIAALYITQSTQRLEGDVPLIAGRDGFLRVFVVASDANDFQPSVRIQFRLGDTLVHEKVISSPGPAVPTGVEESSLSSSWNVPVPASVIRPGLEILAVVDWEHQVPESNEGDNHFPLSMSPLALDVRTPPPFRVTFVPVRQSTNGLVGNVTGENAAEFLDLTRRMLPLEEIDVRVHAEYVTDAPALVADDSNGAWGAILAEMDALRLLEGASRHHYGVVQTNYGGGTVGMAYTGLPVAVGWDRLPNASSVAAHEWGHNWALGHAPGCEATFIDPAYPYASGKIGVWGFDLSDTSLKSPSGYFDFMSYCYFRWVSDYHYEKVLENRRILEGAGVALSAESSLLLWGRVRKGRVLLEPSVQVTTSPVLPDGKGDFLLEGMGPSGEILYSGAFRPVPVPDARGEESHFAFALPVRVFGGGRLSGLRVSGPGVFPGVLESGTRPGRVDVPFVTVEPRGELAAEVRWNASSFPMVLIRDPGSGEVLSLARRGAVDLSVSPGEIEMVFSHGLGSTEPHRRVVR